MSEFHIHRLLPRPNGSPTLVVVIDTEEEFDWAAPFNRASTGVSNIGLQHLAQSVFDAHGVVPTYAVDYPVATTPSAIAALRPIQDSGRCEIGAHLHPWVNPPPEEEVNNRNSFASNLPPGLMQRKLAVLTDAIEAGFGTRPVVFKAGRYGVGAETAAALGSLGYTADVSVVPYTDFSPDGGPDFSAMTDQPFLAAENLVAIPLSVHFAGAAAGMGRALFPLLQAGRRLRLPGIAARLGLLERLRLSPEGHDLQDMIRQTEAALAQGVRQFMLTYHSSTILPGATSYARSVLERDEILNVLSGFIAYFMRLPGAATTTARLLAARLANEAHETAASYTSAPTSAI